jgi:integrase
MKPKLVGKKFKLAVCVRRIRTTLTLGEIDKREATKFAAMIGSLVDCKKYGRSLPIDVSAWVSTVSERHKQQLAELGLLDQPLKTMTVQELIDVFLHDYEGRNDIRESSKVQFASSMNRFPFELRNAKLVDIEPRNRTTRPNADPQFSQSAIDLFRSVERWQAEKYAQASWSKSNGRLREVGVWAVKRGILDHNPFKLLSKPGEVNEARNHHVPADAVTAAMDHCIDPDTRLAFAFGRFGGLRMPSELSTLRPSDIDFEKSKVRILDSKKRRFRTMPLFSILRAELERHRQSVVWGDFVLSDRVRNASEAAQFNLMKEAIARAGLVIWPRLRQNLRASCENDLLAQGFGERLVTAWMGHTVSVSRQHYQNMSDAEFQNAVDRQADAIKNSQDAANG